MPDEKFDTAPTQEYPFLFRCAGKSGRRKYRRPKETTWLPPVHWQGVPHERYEALHRGRSWAGCGHGSPLRTKALLEKGLVMDWKRMDVGSKDLIIGFGLLGAMALVAVVLAIIESL